jgi:hypothetical protein
MDAPFVGPSFFLGRAPLFSVEGEPWLDGFTFAKGRSTLGVVFGSVSPRDFSPRYSSNIAFISNPMKDFKVSKDAKCSSREIEGETEMDGGVSWGGVYLLLSSSLGSPILLEGVYPRRSCSLGVLVP